MKKFYIYENKVINHVEAVKDGFSWPGFLFTLIWLVYKRMWTLVGAYALVITMIVLAGLSLPKGGSELLSNIFGIAASVWLGLKGNYEYGKHLEKNGYKKIGEILAKDKQSAVYNYIAYRKNTNEIVSSNSQEQQIRVYE